MDQVSDVSIVNHSCYLLFPFYHRFENLSGMDNIEGWQDWKIRLSDESVKRAEESSYYFQPFVRQILFPEWRISDDEEIQTYSTRHLTKVINGQPFNSDFSLQPRSKDGSPDGKA